ncbi:MAG TPA: MFS transporter [Spirochaetota bacterium]|nr:MFS transporter [Spirochaetota bacterium]HOL57929.1 MFS transporter [Spirochaetota bacterium]HPP03667.1 MFS transporter [Spirochaetota bacterium]
MNNRLPLSIQIFYGLGVAYAIVDQIFAQWVLYYYLPPQNSGLVALMPPIFLSIALVISRFFDMILDPLVGFFSDRFNSKWGRRIPFIAIGVIPLVLSTVAYFYPIKSTSGIPTFIYLSITGVIFFIFYTIVGAPYNALIPEISQNREDRLNLSTWQSIFRLLYTAIAMILPGILIKLLGKGDTEKGIRLMVISLGIFATIGMFVPVFTINEVKYSGGKKSDHNFLSSLKIIFSNRSFWFYLMGFLFFFLGFNILRASMNYYVEDLMGMGKGAITIASAILFGVSAIFFFPINRLSKKIGYKMPMLISLLLLIIFSIMLFFLGKIIPTKLGFLIFALMGIPVSGAAFIFPPAMLSEISAVESKKSNVQIEGLFFGVQGFFLKLAFLLSIAILPVILVSGSGLSFVESLIKKPEGVEKFGVYATTIAASISFAFSFLFYSLYKEEIIK